MKQPIRFKLRLEEAKTKFGSLDKVMFEWAKLGRDQYVIYIPKIFNREPGGSVVVVSEKKMMKMLSDHKREVELMKIPD